MLNYDKNVRPGVFGLVGMPSAAATDSALAVTIEASRALSYGLQRGHLSIEDARFLGGVARVKSGARPAFPIEIVKAGTAAFSGAVHPIAQHEEDEEDDLGPLIGEPFELDEEDEAWMNPRFVSNSAEVFNCVETPNTPPVRVPTTIANADVHKRVSMIRLPGASLSQLTDHPRMIRVKDTPNSQWSIGNLRRRLRKAHIPANLDTWVLLDSQGRPIELVVRVQPCLYPRPMVVSTQSDGTSQTLHEQISVWTPEEAVAVKAVKFGRIAYLVLMSIGDVCFDGSLLPHDNSAHNNNGLMATQGTHLGLVNLDSSHKSWMPRTVDCLSGAVESLRKVDFQSTYAMYRLFTDPTVFHGGVL